MILRQLHRRLGQLSDTQLGQIKDLLIAELEDLGEALLDFTEMADLDEYLSKLG